MEGVDARNGNIDRLLFISIMNLVTRALLKSANNEDL